MDEIEIKIMEPGFAIVDGAVIGFELGQFAHESICDAHYEDKAEPSNEEYTGLLELIQKELKEAGI